MSLTSLFRTNRFTKLESSLLDMLKASLCPEARAILQRQLEGIVSIRRLSGEREILCYRKKGKVPYASFPAQQAELKFCSILFSVNGDEESWTADFLSVSGYFSSITFTPSAQKIRNRADIRLENLDMLADVMSYLPEPSVHSKPVARPDVALPPWVIGLETRFEARDLYTPLETDQATKLRKAINAVLPADYLKLIAVTEGLTIGKLSVLGLSQVYEIVLPNWNYYQIAELHSTGALGVRTHSADAEIYWLDYAGAAPRKMGQSLAEAVRTLLIGNNQ